MEILSLMLLGFLQGITEFLPISSSGHLVLFGNIFGIEETLFVSILLHLATLLSVIIVFRGVFFFFFLCGRNAYRRFRQCIGTTFAERGCGYRHSQQN